MDPLLDYMDPSSGSLHGFPLQITWLPLLISQISISVLIDPFIDSTHRFHGSPYTFSLQISWISFYICLRFHGSRHTLHGSSHRFHRFPLQMSWISLQICGSPQRLSLIEFMDPHTDVMGSLMDSPHRFHGSPYRLHGSPYRFDGSPYRFPSQI